MPRNDNPRYSSDRRERARQLVADGKIGGARPGSGRKRRATTLAEAMRPFVDEHAEEIRTAIRCGLKSDSDRVRLEAVRLAIKVPGLFSPVGTGVDAADMSEEDLNAALARLIGPVPERPPILES